MLLLVSFIGWVVVRYAAHYLDGEPRQGRFTAWLCLTLAAVLTLVTAGNLVQFAAAWVATSLFLHHLLLFYPARVAAQRAARKKFLSARLGDAALIGASVLLFINYGTIDLAQILGAARTESGNGCTLSATVLLALAALLKSAQFPTHGWLTEVMETPTPVSALLHAGVINAGGFLLIRFADVMVLHTSVLAVLVMIGGFTALFGGLVMLTQPAVKTSLAWSTVAQMGFMVLECGLGLFPLALLHILAHSLYKAHSFLVSGAAVETIAVSRRPGLVAIPNAAAVGRAFLLALSIYVAVGFAFGFQHKSPQAIALRRELRDARSSPTGARTRTARMGADHAHRGELRDRRGDPGDVPPLGQPSGGGGTARTSVQRLVCQRHLRPIARRVGSAQDLCINLIY